MRMRFTAAEKAAFTIGAVVEVRNGRWWYPAVVTGPVDKYEWSSHQHIMCEVTSTAGRKGTVNKGDAWGCPPTNIRVPE